MTDPENKDVVVPPTDAFGESIKKEGEPEVKVDTPAPKEGEDKGGEGKLTPTQQIADLSRKLGEYAEREKGWGETQKSKDENIRAMKDSIKRLENQVLGKRGEKGKDEGGEKPLFAEIRTSKDLTADERDEMTDTEIKQMDMIASLQQGMNELAGKIEKGAEGKKEDGTVVDIQGTVKETAKELANGDKDLANQIIESVKKFNLTDLSEEEIASRVAEAATLIPTYKKPKEQAGGKKGAPAGGGANNTDPYGVDKIVEEVSAKKENNGFAL